MQRDTALYHLGLRLVGMNVDPLATEIILRAIEKIDETRDQFSLKDAAKIIAEAEALHSPKQEPE